MTNPSEFQARLCFVLHRALVEVRLLAQGGRTQQVFDLADALEPLPAWMVAWKDDHLEELRFNLGKYEATYPSAFQYLHFIDGGELPAGFGDR